MIVVRDIDDAAKKYEAIGLRVKKWELLNNNGLVRQAFLMTGPDTFIELIQPVEDSGSDAARFLARKGQGVYGVTYQVDDVNASVRRLQDRGIELVGVGNRVKGGSTPPGGVELVWIHPRHTPGMLVNIQDTPCYLDLLK